MTSTTYGRSQGLRLLESAARQLGPLFTRQALLPLAQQQGISSGHLSKLLSLLNASGHIVILKRGLYALRSPLFAAEVHPFAVATALVTPSAISHWSALAYHGFTTQLSGMVQASTPVKVVTPEMRHGGSVRPRGRAVWRALDVEVEYIHVSTGRFFGHQRIWVNAWQQVIITDAERTALDLIARADLFGGLSVAIEMLAEALPRLELPRLVEYALQYRMGSVIKRLGWALEQLGVAGDLLAPLQAYPVRTWYALDPQAPRSAAYNPRWRVIENLRSGGG